GAGGEIQLTDGLQDLAKSRGLYAYKFDGIRYDTGDRVGFIDATVAYALKRPELKPAVLALMKKHLEAGK
ncbi:MAG TPA: UTP--glucose-1-phosphate uridylyltransferase, partial [Bdellovibrionota bacterium]|nr:UTP--glucose-1-phosphate uridylyltransferase [Bdellovibrionota bacterium]